MIGSTMFAWTPTLLDALTPFALGAGEFAMAYAVPYKGSSFLLAMLATSIAGTLAYGDYWFHAHRGFDFNQHSVKALRTHLRSGIVVCASGSALILVAYAARHLLQLDRHDTVVPLVLIAPFVGMGIHSIWSWNLAVRRLWSKPQRREVNLRLDLDSGSESP